MFNIGWEGVDLIHVAQDIDSWCAVVSTVMNLRVPLTAGNFVTRWKNVNFSRKVFVIRTNKMHYFS